MEDTSESEEENWVYLAKKVHLLMKNDYRISRNIRAQWFLEHLNSILHFKPLSDITNTQEELTVLSVEPQYEESDDELPLIQNGEEFRFQLLPSTVVTFLAKRYRLVFVLDISPSAACVDLRSAELLIDKVYINLKRCITGLVKPFVLPSTNLLFAPELYVTIIAHTPVLACTANQVLVQGVKVMEHNVADFLDLVYDRFDKFEQSLCMSYRKITRHNLTEDEGQMEINDAFASPHNRIVKLSDSQYNYELGIINLIRQGLFALQLLPENSSAGIVIMTDGMLGVPDAHLFDSLMTQLRSSTIACSFLKIGDTYCARSQFGFVPHIELLQFIATATFGAYFSSCPDVSKVSSNQMNVYQKALLFWSFQKGLEGFKYELTHHQQFDTMHPAALTTRILSHPFYKTTVVMPTVRKKHLEIKLNTTISSVLSVRLREGYTIKDVHLTKNGSQIEVRLVLPWKNYVKIEYAATATWPMDLSKRLTHAEIIIEGSYDFLHDLTCPSQKIPWSSFRINNVKRFWMALQRLRETDQLLVHLQSFGTNPSHYKVPDSIKVGVPVFHIPQNSTTSTNPVLNTQLNNKDTALLTFALFWKPVVNLDIKIWQKWMHSHKIGMVLEHDVPLTKYMHTPNSSGRFSAILTRQALTSLNAFLRDWSSFILIENHSYIKLIFSDSDKPPSSFLLLRVTSKPPCMVLRVAFLGGTAGEQRHCILQELRTQVAALKFPKRATTKVDKLKASSSLKEDNEMATVALKPPLQREWSEINCCVLLTKPVEHILISYDRLPQDMTVLEDPSRSTQSHMSMVPQKSTVASAFNTLSRYMHHQRWIWTVKQSHVEMNMQVIGRILSTLAKIRLQEGFNYASSTAGIVNMVVEVDMVNEEKNEVDMRQPNRCFVQYILFPPFNKTSRDSVSEDDIEEMETTEADGEVQIVTECWIEPQSGVSINNPAERCHWNGLNYKQIATTLYPPDLECISCLVTFEHLVYVCQNTCAIPTDIHWLQDGSFSSRPGYVPLYSSSSQDAYKNIHQMVLPFDILALLPRSQQAELKLSSYRLVELDASEPELKAAEDLQDERPKDIKGSNSLLMNLMFEKLKYTNQREVTLSVADCKRFLSLLVQRKRNLSVNPFPFPVDEMEDVGVHQGQENINTRSSEITNDKTIPLWRCFVRAFSNTRLFLTFIPSSFDNLLKLNKLDVNLKTDITTEVGSKDLSELESSQAGDTCVTTPADIVLDTGSLSTLNSTEDEKYAATNIFIDDKDRLCKADCKEKEDKAQKEMPSCVIPIYVYECILSNVTESLIDPWHFTLSDDLYEDFTFHTEVGMDDSLPLKSPIYRFPSFERDSTPGSDDKDEQENVHQMLRLSQERRVTESSVDGTGDLSKQCGYISDLYYNCYVNGVFQSLQQKYPVDPRDIDAAINNICFESSPVETDITSFLLASCQHFQQIVEMAKNEVKEQNETEGESRRHSVRFMDIMDDNESESAVNRNIPSVFHLPNTQAKLQTSSYSQCEYIKGLHDLICSKFNDMVKKWFRLVPKYPNYYFYCPEVAPQDNSLDEGETDDKQNTTEQSDNGNNQGTSPRDKSLGVELEFRDDFKKSHDDGEIESVISNMDSQSFLGSDYDLCLDMAEDDNRSTEPLFIHFTCTIKSRLQNENVSVQTLVPCLNELLTSVSDPMQLNLGDLKITFDINCMTLHYDSELSPKKPVFFRMMSSTSEPPTSPGGSEAGVATSTEMGPLSQFTKDPVHHLPQLQHHAVLRCKEELEWLLKDEIASALRHLYPIKSDALQFVMEHVRSSCEKGKPNCVTDNVHLNFVYGAERSLTYFKEEFERLNYHGYRVTKEDEFYLVKGKPHSFKSNYELTNALTSALVELSREGTPAKQVTPNNTDLYQTAEDITLSPESNVMTTYVSPAFLSPAYMSPDMPGYKDSLPQNISNASSNVVLSDISGSEEVSQIMSTKDTEQSSQGGKTSTENESSESKDGQKETPVKKTLRLEKIQGKVDRKRMADVLELKLSKDRFTDSPPTPPVKTAIRSASLGEVMGEVALKKSSSFAGFHSEDNCEPFKRQDSLTALSCSPIKASSGGTPHLPSLGRLRHSSAPSGQGTPHSKASTLPQTPSWISSRGSYTEEAGYDGDSSDTEDGMTAFSDASGRQQHVPKFWLLMQVGGEGVDLFFHARETGNEENEDKLEQRALLTYFRESIENLCRKVNQKMLLDDLFSNRMCDNLLVPEADDEIKWTDEKPLSGKRHLDSSDASEGEDEEQRNKSYLMAAMELHHAAGYFECECVKSCRFYLHPRLKMAVSKTNITKGMHALRSILNKFSVNNRKNMFVIKETAESHAVFYLRLKEVSGAESASTSRQISAISNEDISFTDSSSSAMFLAAKKDDQALQVPEKDTDSVSVTSVGSTSTRPSQDYILLHVHGIQEPGPEIQVDLVRMLQKKLDDTVLDNVSLQLTRNPVSKLSPEDVHFIQKPEEAAAKTLRLTVPPTVGTYLSALIYYLQQNLLQFSHTPNYADNKPCKKFQCEVNGIWQAIEEGFVFLYIRPHAMGGKGIACISLSVVDERGSQIRIFNSPKPARTGYTKVHNKEEFNNMVATDLYTATPSSVLGLTSLIQFCIWERGSVDLNALQEKLISAVRHALCDVVTEYYLLTASICPVPAQLQELLPTPSVSAPSSPITTKDELKPLPMTVVDDKEAVIERRHSVVSRKLSDSLRMTMATNSSSLAAKTADKSYSPSPLQSLKEAFSSKARVTSPPPDSQKVFDFTAQSIVTGTPPSSYEHSQEIQAIIKKYEEGERGNLHHMFNDMLSDWFDFCNGLGVPSVSKVKVDLISKFSVDYFLKEFIAAVISVSSDIQPKVFRLGRDSSGIKCGGTLYCPLRSPLVVAETSAETSLDCEKRISDSVSMVMVGRNVDQWQASIQSIGEEEYSEQTATSMKAIPKQTFQKFPPLLKDTFEDRNQDVVDMASEIQDHVFIPRQRLLLLTLENKELTLYLYNWARDLSSILSKKMTQLVQWHNCRIKLLESIISQKMGLYHHSRLKDQHKEMDVEHLIKCSAPPPKEPIRRQNSMSIVNRETFRPFDESCKDLQPLMPLNQTGLTNIRDPVAKHGQQVQELRTHSKKDMEKIMSLNKLYWAWFGKNNSSMSTPLQGFNVLILLTQQSEVEIQCSDEASSILLLKQTSRLFHYCATPLLFHPQWRQKVMEKYKVTQNRTTTPTPTTILTTEKEAPKTRSRHSSGTSVTSMRTKRSDSQEGKKRPVLLNTESTKSEETWHVELRNSFLGEYIQYIQSLGFVLIQTKPTTPKKGPRHMKKPSLERGIAETEVHSSIGVVDLQKTSAGGIMLMELSFREQYFCVKMYTCEYTRLGVPVNQQSYSDKQKIHTSDWHPFTNLVYGTVYRKMNETVSDSLFVLLGLIKDTQNLKILKGSYKIEWGLNMVRVLFVEECEKCKDLIHVHSFAHDFHLRCIQSHITRQQVFRQSYHLTGFLMDFMQVYPYPPRFSRNCLHTDTKQIGPLTFSGQQLYEFMLQQVKLHNMKVIGMVPTVDMEESDYHFVKTTEYALIQNKLSKAKVPKMDDYNVGLIIIHNYQQVNFQSEEERNMLKLTYFIVLTSNRELFPKDTEGTKAAVFLEELKDCSKPVPVKQHIGVRQETNRTLKNPHVYNTPAYALLQEEAQIAREQIENMVEMSIAKCRKDLLWQRMLVGNQSEEDSRRKKRSETEESRDGYQKLSFDEFLELMTKVIHTPLNSLDQMLMPLQNMSFQWYKGLFRVLQSKYPETHRCFSSNDGQVQYILILNPNYLDMFMMLMVDNNDKKTDLCAVFRDPISDQEHTPESPSLPILSMQSHVEDFVNACCYHMWASMI